MLCSRCKKNVAVLFITKMENGKTINEGLCMPCARDLGITSVEQMAGGMNPTDFENIGKQVNEVLGSFPEEEMQQVGGMINNLFGSLNAPDGAPKEGGGKKTTAKPFKTEKKRILDAFGTNLTEKAKRGEVDKVIGRDSEIDRMIQILNRRSKNNPALLGEPGVGKTAIAEGLAERIVKKEVPAKLQNREIYLLDFTAIVAGTQYRGQFEARLKSIIEEAKKLGNIILVIDEMHNIVGAGDAEGAMSAANILKPALARGDIQVIGATTLTEYRKFIEKDSALERRFQPVMVEEPSVEDTIDILKGIKGYYEAYHCVKITDEVIRAAAVLSERYITDRFLPDKAIDVIDEAGSKANLKNAALATLAQLEAELRAIEEEKSEAVKEDSIEDYRKAADLKTRECAIREQIDNVKAQLKDVYLTIADVAAVIESWTKIPVKKITEAETARLLSLEENLHKRVVGQDRAVSAVSRAIRRSRAALAKKRRPASFIFVGPTGVGKTELVKALACELFDSEDALIRIDMSEYMERHSVAKLIGSPPGYVGYDDSGQLTEKVRRHPYSVILFDEVEKAHADVLNVLLQILDDGRVSDSHGKVVSFENTVIVMTSNAGSDWKTNALGFTENASRASDDKRMGALKEFFRPEFLNRVDEVITFDALTRENLRGIADIMLGEMRDMLAEKGMELIVTDAAKDYLTEHGYDEKMGARPLRRLIEHSVGDKVADIIIRGIRRESITLDVNADELIVE